jgi:hypothetical protein
VSRNHRPGRDQLLEQALRPRCRRHGACHAHRGHECMCEPPTQRANLS